MAQLKALEQKEANSPRRRRRQEIIKLRAEINQVETKRTILSLQFTCGHGLLHPLVSLAKGLSILLIFFKEPAPGFVDSLYGSLNFYLIDFSSEFDDFLPSTPPG